MKPPSVTFSRKNFWVFLSMLAVMGMALGGVATSRYGAGIASDSTKYLSVAQSLMDGNGLYDHRGVPLIAWPPLYSIMLAGLSLLTKRDVFIAGWYLNVFILGLNLFLSGVIFQRVFSAKPLYAYLSSLFVFLSISSLRIYATISSDAFYLTLTLIFLIAADGYIQQRSYRAFALMVLLCALAPLLRYVGMALAVTAAIIILIENRKLPRVVLRDGLVLGVFSIAPIFWWLIIHNLITYGSLWGTGSGQVVDVYQNTMLALTKMLHWFVPYLSPLMPVITKPLIPLGALALILYFVNRRKIENGRAWIQAFTVPAVYPSMVYGLVYFVAVALTAVTDDHRSLFSDRYYVILMVQVVLFVAITFDALLLPHLSFSRQQIDRALVVLFVLWSIYPVYGIREYLAKAVLDGEPSETNIFNTRAYHDMEVVAEMKQLRERQPGANIYSNYVDAVWFYTRRPVLIPPFADVSNPSEFYAGWPHDKPGYLIWFKPNEYKHYLSPDDLAEIASLSLVYESDSGDIYFVKAR